MTTKPKVGVLVMALLEDDYNKTAHMRPMAQKAADRIGEIIAEYAESSAHPWSRRNTRPKPRHKCSTLPGWT